MSNDYYNPEIIRTHYIAFKEFLESQDNDPKRQRGAKEKLIKLTNQQFQELSTDVYDELIRRTYNYRESECLQSQSEFQPKRNEARAKLAALSQTRYRDLSQDIYNEIQRRFPNIVVDIENETQKQIQGAGFNGIATAANANIENSKQPGQYREQSPNKINFAPLDNVMANLAKELNENDNLNNQNREVVNIELNELRRANTNLKSKLDSINEKYTADKSRLERELESTQETLTNQIKIYEEQAKELSKLYGNYTQLQTDIKTLRSQTEVNEKITEELRQENDNQIAKVNDLTRKNEQLESENTALKKEIDRLKEELKKEREKKSAVPEKPIEVPVSVNGDRNIKPESPKKTPEQAPKEDEKGISSIENELSRGAVKDCINPERFNHYKEAVNDLLAASTSDNPADVLVAMKSIVITCKNITEESDEYERINEKTFTIEEQDKLIEIKDNLSVALTNLMNVTKNHATNYPDVSPSFIESATSDLSVTIVSLVRTLKEHQTRLLEEQNGSTNAQPTQQLLKSENLPNNEPTYDIPELKNLLEEKTELIVQGIQSLLQKIQQPNASNDEFLSAIKHITDIVDNVIGASQNTFTSAAGSHLYSKVEKILQDLRMGNYRLKDMGNSIHHSNEQEIKTLKSSLASASYEIAVYVRDLLELLD